MYELLILAGLVCGVVVFLNAIISIQRFADKRKTPLKLSRTVSQARAWEAWKFSSRWGFSIDKADDIYEHFLEDTREDSPILFKKSSPLVTMQQSIEVA